MELELANTSTCTDAGCRVRFIDGDAWVDADYSEAVVDYGIVVRPGDLVAVDRATDPPRVLFRWVWAVVDRVEGEQIFISPLSGCDGPLTLAEGLDVNVAPEDEVFFAYGRVQDVCVDGWPTHPERLRAAFFPEIRALYARIAAWQELDPKQVVERGYDRIAERYLEWTQAHRLEERARYTSALLDALPRGAEVLDLGCGAGLPTTHELARRFRVTGVDLSARQIALARQNVPGAQFVQADLTQLDLAPASFDAVVAFYALFHVPREQHAQLLRDVATWLRPGGWLVATMGARAIKRDFTDDYLGAQMYWSCFDCETNRRLVEEAGLKIVSAEEETADEFGRPVTFLWVRAQKPSSPPESGGEE